MKTLDYYYDWLRTMDLFTEAELQLITDMYGYDIETLDWAVYCRFGFQTVQSYIDNFCNVQRHIQQMK